MPNSPAAVAPSGAVNFFDNGNAIVGADLNNGTASLTIDCLGVGAHAITASYAGDTTHGAATAGPINVIVNGAIITPVQAAPMLSTWCFSCLASPSPSPSRLRAAGS